MLEVTNVGGQLVVDSRLVAESLGIDHESFVKTLVRYQERIETAFGVLRLEVGKPQSSTGGRPCKFYWLNEDQATFLMTLSRNTDQVVEAKLGLVVAFKKAKEQVIHLSSLLDRDADHRPVHNAFTHWCHAYKFEISSAAKAVVRAATGLEYHEVMCNTEHGSKWSVDVVTPEMVDSITRLKRSLSNSQRKKGETLEQVIARVVKRDKLVLA